MHEREIMFLSLRLFDGEGGGSAGPGTEGGTPATASSDTQTENTGDLSKVVYGKQPNPDAGDRGAAAQNTELDSFEDRAKRFDELIKNEYKDVYTKRAQDMINRRFAKAKQAETENAQYSEIANMLNAKYGISDDKDHSKLKAAIENDNTMWEQAADEAGMTVEQYKRFQQLERQNQYYEEARRNQYIDQQVNEQSQRWYNEAQALKEKFPDFDLKTELQDRNFVAAMRAGVPMELVYKGKYYDESMQQTAAGAAAYAEKQVTDNIRSKGKRPAENGTAAQAPFTIKSDPSKLNLKDFEELQRRVMRGDKITF